MARRNRPPYTSQSDLDTFFGKIANLADPGKIDKKWVQSYKLSAAQPEAIVTLLLWLGVIDEQHQSTGVWNDLRVPASHQAKLEELVRSSYKDVFDRIDVAQATREDLKGTFIQAYDSGNATRPVACFIALCERAGIPTGASATARAPSTNEPANRKRATKPEERGRRAAESSKSRKGSVTVRDVVISLNVEIPADWSEDEIRDRYETVRRITGADSANAP